MIKFSHVYKTYSGTITALKDISLEIDRGEFVYLTGPSGAGKSTLFKMISAFDKPCSGDIEVEGYSINDISSKDIPYLRRRIGVVYQDFKLLKTATVFDNVALPLRVRGDNEISIKRRVIELLEEVGLVFKKDRFPEFLSGGEQQRVAIARALAAHPGLLIADEPTGNLDPELSEEIMDLLDRVNAQGTTVFVATHDHDLVNRRKRRQAHIVEGHLTWVKSSEKGGA